MMNDDSAPILKRMAASAVAVDVGAERLAGSVAVMLGKVSRSVLGLSASASDIATGETTLARVAELVPRGALMVVLHQAGAPVGLFALDAAIAAALSEYRLTGLLVARSGPSRPVTDIDAELLREFIDGALAGLCDILPETPALLAFGSHLPDVRSLPYVLRPEPLQSLSASVSLGEGETKGPAIFLLPHGYLDGAAPRAPSGAGADAVAWRDRLHGAVEGAPVMLEGVLHRCRMPLDRLRRLAPGDRIDLPRDAIGHVVVEAQGRLPVFAGRLGQARGQRAIRIGQDALALDDVDPAV